MMRGLALTAGVLALAAAITSTNPYGACELILAGAPLVLWAALHGRHTGPYDQENDR